MPLGSGNFGVVFRGTFTPEGCLAPMDVAIKGMKNSEDFNDLVKEAKIMARVNGFINPDKTKPQKITFHDNVVNLQGMVCQYDNLYSVEKVG